jgi:hypothetical protein
LSSTRVSGWDKSQRESARVELVFIDNLEILSVDFRFAILFDRLARSIVNARIDSSRVECRFAGLREVESGIHTNFGAEGNLSLLKVVSGLTLSRQASGVLTQNSKVDHNLQCPAKMIQPCH